MEWRIQRDRFAIGRAPRTSRRVSPELSVQASARMSTSIDLAIRLPSFQWRDGVYHAALPFALLAEREQVAVHEVGMRGGEAVRQARIVDFDRSVDQLVLTSSQNS